MSDMIKPVLLIFSGRGEEDQYLYTVRLEGPQGQEAHPVTTDEHGRATEAAEIDSLVASLGNESTDLLLRAVSELHKAARVMFYDPATLQVVPPATRPKRLKPIMIAHEGLEEGEDNRHLYRVLYEASGEPISHVFVVDGDVMTIAWEDAFFNDMGHSTTLATPLLSSIMDLYEAAYPKTETLPID
jgi:hypothetical protein